MASNHWQRIAAAKRETTSKSDYRAVVGMAESLFAEFVGKHSPQAAAVRRVAGLDPVYNEAIALGGVVVSESPIEPRRQPPQVVTVVEPVNAAPAPVLPKTGKTPSFSSTAPAGMVKIDPGFSPLVMHRNITGAYCLYIIAQQIHRDHYRGRNNIPLQVLRDALAGYGVTRTRGQINRDLRAGERAGLFQRDGDTLRLTGYKRLWRDSSERLCKQGKRDVVKACQPKNPVYIAPGGSLIDFKATLYTAWIDAHVKTYGYMRSRSFLCQIWNVSENTLRSWEQGRVEAKRNFAQYGGSNTHHLPSHHTIYPDRNGIVRYTWRMPNRYTSVETIIEHTHKGQRSKANNVRNYMLKMYQLDAIPTDLGAVEESGKRYFTDKVNEPGSAFKSIAQYNRTNEDHLTPRFAMLGMKNGVGVFELFDPDTQAQQTGLNERDFAQERRKTFRQYSEFYDSQKGAYA